MSNKVAIKTAKSSKNTFYLNKSVGTTSKFYEPTIPFIKEFVGGSELEINVGTLHRVDPMPLPPMSGIKFTTKFYYVPMIDILPYWHELKAQTPYAYRFGLQDNKNSCVIPDVTPTIDMLTIKKMFFNKLMASHHVSPVNTNSFAALYLNTARLINSDDGSNHNDYVEVIPFHYEKYTGQDGNVYYKQVAHSKYDVRIKLECSVPRYHSKEYVTFNQYYALFELVKELGFDTDYVNNYSITDQLGFIQSGTNSFIASVITDEEDLTDYPYLKKFVDYLKNNSIDATSLEFKDYYEYCEQLNNECPIVKLLTDIYNAEISIYDGGFGIYGTEENPINDNDNADYNNISEGTSKITAYAFLKFTRRGRIAYKMLKSLGYD